MKMNKIFELNRKFEGFIKIWNSIEQKSSDSEKMNHYLLLPQILMKL